MTALLPDVPGYFITGTDTGVGKTRVSLALMSALKSRGLTVLGMKPLATGSQPVGQLGLRNADALALQSHGSKPLAYKLINPCVYAPPIAPHIAAMESGSPVRMDAMLSAWRALRPQADRVVVEGVGGWRVPLSEEETLADLVRAMAIPVILVVGMRLGCISHALLTAECIVADRLPLLGWVACHVQSELSRSQFVLDALAARLPAPLLATLPYLAEAEPDVEATYFQDA